MTAAIDGIVLLCRFHASHLPLHAQHKVHMRACQGNRRPGVPCLTHTRVPLHGWSSQAVLSTNALDPAGFVDGPNRRLTFIYASSPSRGLEQVRRHPTPSLGTHVHIHAAQPRAWGCHAHTLRATLACRR